MIDNNQDKKLPKKRGRPRIKFTEEDLLKVEEASGRGLTNQQLADFLGVSLSTVRRSKKNYELFEHHIRQGRAKALKEVSNALYNNAINENNVQAQIFFLKNRGEEGQWSEKNEQNLQINLSSVLNEANARMIEGEKVQEVKERDQFLIKEMPNEKQAEK